jgi:hypothetical protein
MYHLGYSPGTFQEFRGRFGSRAEAARESNTGTVNIDDPPTQIAANCELLRLPFWETEFTSNMRFGKTYWGTMGIFQRPTHIRSNRGRGSRGL